MKRVLIVSPHFPPVNAADHQRVRMALPYLAELGWEATVLAAHPDDVETGRDPLLCDTVPSSIQVEYLRVMSPKITRKIGLGSLALRILPPLGRRGAALLSSGAYDLVFFSTTCFATMSLGPRWKRRFGVPYILDFQDPWLNDYYERSGIRPPGGHLKYGFSTFLARRMEPPAVKNADHIISVSVAYPEVLKRRYPQAQNTPTTVLPFGGAESDFALIERLAEDPNPINFADGCYHWVYIGRGGADMARGLRILFSALKLRIDEEPALASRLKLHFIGTSYAKSGTGDPTILPVAREFGLQHIVHEQTDRIPYFSALRLLTQSDVIMLIGSDDSAYTASKLYPCVLAKRPLLGVFHEASSVVKIARDCRAGEVVTFGGATSDDEARSQMVATLSRLTKERPPAPDTNWDAFVPYTAKAMTEKLVAVFNATAKGATG